MNKIVYVALFVFAATTAAWAGTPFDTVATFDKLLQKYSASAAAPVPKYKNPCVCREAPPRRVGILVHVPPVNNTVNTPFFMSCGVPSYDAAGIFSGPFSFCSDFDIVAK